jgi:hypothetical protein
MSQTVDVQKQIYGQQADTKPNISPHCNITSMALGTPGNINSSRLYNKSACVWAKLESTQFWSNKGTRIFGVHLSITSWGWGQGLVLKRCSRLWVSSWLDHKCSLHPQTPETMTAPSNKTKIHSIKQWVVQTKLSDDLRNSSQTITHYVACLICEYPGDTL